MSFISEELGSDLGFQVFMYFLSLSKRIAGQYFQIAFRLITGHDCSAAHLYKLSLYPSPICVLCTGENSIMNQDHLLKCTVLNTENTPSIATLYWGARR
jgi:hypothetical protein